MKCNNCNVTGVDPKTRAICTVCNGSPESVLEVSPEKETVVEKVKKAVKKK